MLNKNKKVTNNHKKKKKKKNQLLKFIKKIKIISQKKITSS